MTTTIAPIPEAAASTPAAARPAPPAPTAAASTPIPKSLERAADLRLTIAEVEGRYVYKFVDQATGEVVRILPREAAQDMAKSSAYTPGEVYNART